MITGILLAAGRSQRYGSNKLLSPVKNGVAMAIVAARNLLAAVDEVVVVVPPNAGALAEQLQQECLQVVCCDNAAQGMSESLKAGLLAANEATGWLIALADMPFIQVKTICSVSQQLQKGASIVAPYYRGNRGHPVGFGTQHKAELLSLEGDRGAWGLLKQHAAQICKVNCNDPAILIDVDTLADMRRVSDVF